MAGCGGVSLGGETVVWYRTLTKEEKRLKSKAEGMLRERRRIRRIVKRYGVATAEKGKIYH